WNHQELIPISALAGGPKQCMARLNSAAVLVMSGMLCTVHRSQPKPVRRSQGVPKPGPPWGSLFSQQQDRVCQHSQVEGRTGPTSPLPSLVLSPCPIYLDCPAWDIYVSKGSFLT
ncbi:hypothetical protein JOQ06_012360, partial [Pogonophryne albipinna]